MSSPQKRKMFQPFSGPAMNRSTIVLVRHLDRSLIATALLVACSMSRPALASFGPPDIVYLNRCAAGCVVTPGADDAANHVSSLLDEARTVAAFAYSDEVFDQAAACVRHVLLPFDIRVVANDPGTTQRREIMLTTTSQTLGFPQGVSESSPYTGNSMENTIGFVFATTLAGDVDRICESSARVIGVLYGLDFVTSCTDVMTSRTGCGEKSFTDAVSECDGTLLGTPGQCILGNTTQNSFAMMLNSAGPPQSLFSNSFEGFEVPHAGPAP